MQGYHEALVIPQKDHQGLAMLLGYHEALVIPELHHKALVIELRYQEGLVIPQKDHQGLAMLLGYHEGLVIPPEVSTGPCDASWVSQGPRDTPTTITRPW